MTEKSFLDTDRVIRALVELGHRISNRSSEIDDILERAYQKNNWFTRDNVLLALDNIIDQFLDGEKLHAFARHYGIDKAPVASKTIGLVFAGNVPLVGFHDWLCVMLAGHRAMVKLSSKDDVLFPFILGLLSDIDPQLAQRTVIVERLKDFDAVIATGSNNSARYFEHYFGKYPHIIRRNRGSVAIIDQETTNAQLDKLAKDIFSFFGLGCRNVSKLFVQRNVDISKVLEKFESYSFVKDHFKYKNNFDYRLTIVLMNNQPHYSNGFVVAVEEKTVSTPLSVLHFEYFDSPDDLKEKLDAQSEDIQVIEGNGFVSFGEAQSPSLFDYPDNVDVMQFLLSF